MSFRDVEEYLDPTIKLPIRGKIYVIESPDAKTGLWVQAIMTAAAQLRAGVEPSTGGLESLVLDDDEERDAMKRVLGATFDELAADRVPWEFVKHAGQTVMVWIMHGKPAAERFWNGSDAAPKAPKKSKKRSGGKEPRKASGGSATTTPSPGSTTAMSESSPSSAGKASPGATSSPTGN